MEGASAVSAEPPTTSSSPSAWHTIRPWTPHFTLAVREITSVSATFILSSSLDARSGPDAEPEPELAIDTPNGTSNDAIASSRGIIADAISQGLSVDVNGSNWSRVFIHMNDHTDEAIIVIYKLHPGRQYDIDLALVSGGTMRKQVITEGIFDVEAESSGLDDERSDEHDPIAALEAITLAPSTSTINESSSQSIPTPSPTPTPEDRLRVLSHQLKALHSEQAALQAALKSSRRDANKTSTALRADIDMLKRASEKAAIAEGKARQRVRTIEDAVRRAKEGRVEIEQMTVADEQGLPGLKARQSEAEAVLRKVKAEADEIRAEREKREEEGRKRKENMKGTCATLNQRLERLGVKKDRLENSVIPDLENQLAEIEQDIEAAERTAHYDSTWDAALGDLENGETHRRHQSHPGSIRHPTQASVQRPGQAHPMTPLLSRHQPRSQSAYRWNEFGPAGLPHPPGLAQPSASGFMHTPTSSMSPSAPSGYPHSGSPASDFPQSPSSVLSRSTSSVASSTLSSKAAPFEPTRNLRAALSSPGTFSTSGASTPFPSIGPSSGAFVPSSATSAFPCRDYPPIQRSTHATHTNTSNGHGGGQLRIVKGTTNETS
ncbi:hypothetical protein BU15DRAFT_88073 [Melanogaster broomeanus]|nr:hypothetical protein BU15DRAFT_88073 [Melanogaster broomeanus]